MTKTGTFKDRENLSVYYLGRVGFDRIIDWHGHIHLFDAYLVVFQFRMGGQLRH